jgi:hypothetical protein
MSSSSDDVRVNNLAVRFYEVSFAAEVPVKDQDGGSPEKRLAGGRAPFGSRTHEPKRCCCQYMANLPRVERLCYHIVPAEV